MTDTGPQKFEMIPINEINVLNPRARNRHQHREITDNIAEIGLKRPVTVSRRRGSGAAGYNLVCGEGRLEAFRILGETEIPAIVIDAPEGDCLVMSLVENIARRQHRPIDLLQEIGSLHDRGYSDTEIGQKTGMTASWANMIINLLERGEERLISAVETGLIPIRFAVDIARANDAEIQDVLMDAYSSGQIKGKRLAAVRRLLENRAKHTKAIKETKLGRKNPARKITSSDLMRLCQREAEKQRLLVKKSNYTQTKLLFLVEALRELLADEQFTTLLRAEHLDTMPRALAARIDGEPFE
jgi:ParB family transcriptional regulator, chromosome partitioning protein